MGLQSLPVAFGVDTAKWICVSTIDVTQLGVAAYLAWGLHEELYGAVLLALILPQVRAGGGRALGARGRGGKGERGDVGVMEQGRGSSGVGVWGGDRGFQLRNRDDQIDRGASEPWNRKRLRLSGIRGGEVLGLWKWEDGLGR